jgi:hypothetical protein
MSFIWKMPRISAAISGRLNANGAEANLCLGIPMNEKLSLSIGYDLPSLHDPILHQLASHDRFNRYSRLVLLLGGGNQVSDAPL